MKVLEVGSWIPIMFLIIVLLANTPVYGGTIGGTYLNIAFYDNTLDANVTITRTMRTNFRNYSLIGEIAGNTYALRVNSEFVESWNRTLHRVVDVVRHENTYQAHMRTTVINRGEVSNYDANYTIVRGREGYRIHGFIAVKTTSSKEILKYNFSLAKLKLTTGENTTIAANYSEKGGSHVLKAEIVVNSIDAETMGLIADLFPEPLIHAITLGYDRLEARIVIQNASFIYVELVKGANIRPRIVGGSYGLPIYKDPGETLYAETLPAEYSVIQWAKWRTVFIGGRWRTVLRIRGIYTYGLIGVKEIIEALKENFPGNTTINVWSPKILFSLNGVSYAHSVIIGPRENVENLTLRYEEEGGRGGNSVWDIWLVTAIITGAIIIILPVLTRYLYSKRSR